jgi:hypothetical protein
MYYNIYLIILININSIVSPAIPVSSSSYRKVHRQHFKMILYAYATLPADMPVQRYCYFKRSKYFGVSRPTWLHATQNMWTARPGPTWRAKPDQDQNTGGRYSKTIL